MQQQQSYIEIPPPPSLAHLVACLWEMRIPSIAEKRVRILPNACIDIALYGSDTSVGEGSAAAVAPPYRSFVVGSTLRSFIVRSAGWRHVVGASLLPAGGRKRMDALAADHGYGLVVDERHEIAA